MGGTGSGLQMTVCVEVWITVVGYAQRCNRNVWAAHSCADTGLVVLADMEQNSCLLTGIWRLHEHHHYMW